MKQFLWGFVATARTVAVGLALLVSVPAFAEDAATMTGPALWSIENGTSTVHLFGSMHLLKPGAKWRTARFDQVLANADDLVMEIKLDAGGQAAVQKFMMENGIYPPGQTLNAVLPADLYTDLIKATTKLDIPEAAMSRMRPWYAGLVLSMVTIQRLGFDPAQGVEQTIMTEAAGRNIKLTGLETAKAQLSTMANQPPKVQEAMVREALDQLHDIGHLLDEMTAAWTKGDTDKLEKLLIGGFKDYPGLYQAVVVDRNKRWVPEIEALLKKPGHHLIVVGSAHLLGDDSVIHMLRADGIKVERE